ncbi:MAG: hypothetical protein IH977_04315 [Nitrospinae bacterium]|nr:hypothetical protein [Nitrospinota bacterium]
MEPLKGKFTPFEARLELTNIYTDTNHPLHKLYFRQDPMAETYVEALYTNAYGDGKVDLSDGIEIPKR